MSNAALGITLALGFVVLMAGFVLLGVLYRRLDRIRKHMTLAYPRGMMRLAALHQRKMLRQHAYDGFFPPEDVDLRALSHQKVADTPHNPQTGKERELIANLADGSELALLNAKCIVSLRRENPPEVAKHLFHRIWQEHADDLATELDSRWLISSALTFLDHGRNENQRRAGLAAFVATGFMKLYETEHMRYGHPKNAPSKTYPTNEPVFLGLDMFKINGGDLDKNVLFRLYEAAQSDAVIAPLMVELLNRINASDETVFHRFRLIRERQAERKARRAPKKAAMAAEKSRPSPDQDKP